MKAEGRPGQEPEKISVQPSEVSGRRIRSEELFGGLKEIIILHQDEQYRLIRTRSGKLILNK